MYGTVDNFHIGDGVEHIPVNLFSFNFGDKLLVLPNSVKVIDSNSLKGTVGGVVIGDNIEEIGVGAFTNGISVAYVTSSTPRPCSPGAFVNPQTLYVPSGSRSRYLDATGWNEFANIIEQDYIRVTDITLDNNQITLQKGATQQLTATILPDGGIRLLSYSLQLKTYSGNSGALVTFDLTASDDFAGDATIALRNTLFTTDAGVEVHLDNEECHVTLTAEGIKGDVNDDGYVTIADVTVLIDYLLGSSVLHFNSDNADVNGNGEITIADVTALIDMLLAGDN